MTLRNLTPRWWWISALVVFSQPLIFWYVVLPRLDFVAVVSLMTVPVAALWCVALCFTCSEPQKVMRWPACAALTTAATWAMLLMYSLPLVAFAITVLSLTPTSKRTWVLGCLGVVVQAGCLLMVVALDEQFFRDRASWITLGQGLAVWVPAVGIARCCPENRPHS